MRGIYISVRSVGCIWLSIYKRMPAYIVKDLLFKTQSKMSHCMLSSRDDIYIYMYLYIYMSQEASL